jgi:hypothetical protein
MFTKKEGLELFASCCIVGRDRKTLTDLFYFSGYRGVARYVKISMMNHRVQLRKSFLENALLLS